MVARGVGGAPKRTVRAFRWMVHSLLGLRAIAVEGNSGCRKYAARHFFGKDSAFGRLFLWLSWEKREKEKKSCEKGKKARKKEKKSCEKGKNSSHSTPWTIGMMVHGSPYEKRSALSSLQKTKRSAYGLGRKGSPPCSLLISTFWPWPSPHPRPWGAAPSWPASPPGKRSR